jgi:hypothetical protein
VTITRRVAVADTGVDIAAQGLPIITLALRTSDGEWEWLAEQAITTDGEFIYIAGKASHTSTVIGFSAGNYAQSEWTPPGLQVPIDGMFTHHATFTVPLDAPTSPEAFALDNDAVFDLFQDDFGTGAAYQALPYDEPFTHTGVLSGQTDVFNSIGWSDLPENRRGDAMPQAFQEFSCAQAGLFFTPVGYEIVGLGAGNSFYRDQLGLGEASTTVFFGDHVTCIEGTGADIPTPTSGCLIVVHTARGTFISYLRLLLLFDSGFELRRVEVTIEGANDDEPVLAEPSLSDNLYEVLLGLREAGEKELVEVVVTTFDGADHYITDKVAELLGGSTLNVPFPGEPTYGTCPPGTP